MVQFDIVTRNLGEILKQKYDTDEHKKMDFEKQKKLSEIKVNAMIEAQKKKQHTKGPVKLNLAGS